MAISLSALGLNPDRLYHGQPPVSPGAVAYTAPGAGTARTKVSSVLVCNPSPSPLNARLGLIPSGGTNDGTHYLLADQQIPANTTLVLEPELMMRPGDALHCTSDSLPPPVGGTGSTATTGGTLAAATYFYKITATNANGETLPSTEVVVTTTGTTSTITLSWTRLLGATGYKVYRATTTTQTETLLATISAGTTITYLDTGSISPSGAMPTAGTAGGLIFTLSGAEIPA